MLEGIPNLVPRAFPFQRLGEEPWERGGSGIVARVLDDRSEPKDVKPEGLWSGSKECFLQLKTGHFLCRKAQQDEMRVVKELAIASPILT